MQEQIAREGYSEDNICSMGTERIQAKENMEAFKIEGDEPKGTTEMRKASIEQRSDGPGCVSIKRERGAAIA